MSFNHFDDQGQAIMVDISAKVPTLRTATAEAVVTMRPETLAVILEGMSSVWRGSPVLPPPRRPRS
jgi:cyclic pyranopterin phosphate synthase